MEKIGMFVLELKFIFVKYLLLQMLLNLAFVVYTLLKVTFK